MTDPAGRAAVAVGALTACLIGLVGVDAGLLWIVAGVFTLRSLGGASPGFAWAAACLGAGLRWGTLGLGDLQTATRLLGASVLAGGVLVRIGMIAALAGALVDEARRDDLLGGTAVERSASLLAGVALVPIFLVAGPARLGSSAFSWVLAAIGALGAIVLLTPLTRRVPWWAPTAAVVVGVLLSEVAA